MRAPERGRAPGLLLGGFGLASGFLGGLLGVGGGFILVPLQVLGAGIGQRRATATSLAAIIPGSVVAMLVYLLVARPAHVDLRFAALLAAGGVAGVVVGARALHRIPERGLRLVFAVLLAVLGVREVVAP